MKTHKTYFPSLVPLTPSQKEACEVIAHKVRARSGRALLVGGCVRDGLLSEIKEKPIQNSIKDIDIEIFNLSAENLLSLLREDFEIDVVGQTFGVYKVRGLAIDVALPRRESKAGIGHRGFVIQGDPNLDFYQAALRRDFTMNAISWDLLTGELIDPLEGFLDLEQNILRHCGNQFSEDPLRVLRAMQFLARFNMNVAKDTIELCKKITPETLSKERIFEEWKKLIIYGKKPSVGLNFLKECEWVQYYKPLFDLIGCQQRPDRHPEGDVWTHTLCCLDAFAQERIGDPWEDLVVGLTVLCHDMGKPSTTEIGPNGIIRSHGHEAAGERPTREFLGLMTDHKDLIEAIIVLVTHHMRPKELYEAKASDSAIRRLAREVGPLDRLLRVCSADKSGRPPLEKGNFLEANWLLERAEALQVKDQAPKPLILGRHLLVRDLQAGPEFKKILEDAFEAQLNGNFLTEEEGLKWLDKYLKNNKE